MEIPRHIFKAYDIRGISGSEITPILAESLGRAYVAWLKKTSKKQSLTIVVARDMRDTSPEYQAALTKGLTQSGAHVLDIGLASTPAFYFGVGHLGADGGIQVTASHNPAQYNGFKLVGESASPIGGDTGINDIADIIESELFESSDVIGSVEEVGGIPEKHVEHEIAFAGDGDIKPFKIVADPGNGLGAQYLEILFEKLGMDVTQMCWELDGTFPNHESNPFKDDNVVDIKAKVKELGADLGIATDGDGDRVFFIDNEGEVVEPAMVRGILAQRMLERNPGATICYDVRPGKITKDMIEEAGGVPVVTRVGHSLIKAHMKEVGAVYGGESSGHFFYKFDTGIYEGPVVVIIHMLQELSASSKSFAEFIAPLKRYVHSGEINFEVEDKQGMMGTLKTHFNEGELDEQDGITITFADFWFNVRPSNTESVLRLNLEAVDRETMESRRDEIKAIIERGV